MSDPKKGGGGGGGGATGIPGKRRAVNPSVAAIQATMQGHLGLLSAMRTNTGSRAEMEALSKFTADDFEKAKEVQDRLAEYGVGTPSQYPGVEIRPTTDEQEIRDNADFIRRLDASRHAKQAKEPSANASVNIPGGWDYADHTLNSLSNQDRPGLYVDPAGEGTKVHYDNGEEGIEKVLLSVWVDILEAQRIPPPEVQELLPAGSDPRVAPTESITRYHNDAVQKLKQRIVRLGHSGTDEYLKRIYVPANEYNMNEFVSQENENRFRAWMSSSRNDRSVEGWTKLITAQIHCEFRDIVHQDGNIQTLVFRTTKDVFLNVILEAVFTTTNTDVHRIVAHYYTFSLQACNGFLAIRKQT